MNPDVLTTRAADGIAVITLGSAKRIYFDAEMGDALAFVRTAEPGKTVKTLDANYRWHCSKLCSLGVLKATTEREEVKA
jgi:hypothetical protein